MKSRLISLVIVVLLALPELAAQTGAYFITHYNPGEYNFDNTNYAFLQDSLGVMHIANRQGVLNFDGNNWWLTPVPYSAFCLAMADGNLYVGGREGFGVITAAAGSEQTYSPIDTLHRQIIKCVALNNRVYYINDHYLFSFHTANPGHIDTLLSTREDLLDLVVFRNKLYLTFSASGLQQITNTGLPNREFTPPPGAYFVRQSPSGRLLFLTGESDIYIQTKDTIEKLAFDNKDYLVDHSVTEINWVTDSLIAISTFTKGILFVRAADGKTTQLVTYETGLPDNQITSLYPDRAGGVWVMHPFGFSVISPELPLRSFNHYPGLRGTLISVLPYQNQLYVGTTLGVFRLTEKQQVRQSTVYDRVRIEIAPQETEAQEKEEVERKGLFKRKRRKKRQSEKKAEQPARPRYKYVYRQRVVEEVLARYHEFEQLRGIHAKATQLLVYQNQLFAGTSHGVYRLQGDSARQLVTVPVLHMFGLPRQNLLFVSTVEEEVKVLEYQGRQWRPTGMLAGLNDFIDQIALDPEGNVWLCGADSLYRLTIEDRDLVDVEVYGIENPHFDRIYAVNFKGKIHFINSSGYFAYENRKIVRQGYIEAAIGLPKRYLLGHQGELWINTGSHWYGADKDIRKSLNFLSLFKDPQSVARDKGDSFWVITAANDLYKIDTRKIAGIGGEDIIFLKEVRSNDKKIAVVEQLVVNQENSSLTFEFASPDYSGIYRKEYQFRLANTSGTRSPWSAWSTTNNIISYQFLPPDTYTLEVRFRNALGKVVSAEPFTFTIVPPYWKRPWFYMAELVFFGSLLMLSFYLNRGKNKYTFVSRLLGFLTLILIVEFFQTIAEYKFETNESPVINFFIQAFIALLVLPVEALLRKWLTLKPAVELPRDEKGK